jgi:hypothetical protein
LCVDENSYGQSGLSITNNIWYAPSSTNFYWWNNAVGNSLATWNALTGVGTDINADPLFLSATDFHLQAASPAINSGVNVSLTTDYAGRTVPSKVGENPDIGAYEYYPSQNFMRPGNWQRKPRGIL